MTEQTPIIVVLAVQSAQHNAAMKHFIEAAGGFSVVAEPTDHASLLDAYAVHSPDVLILDDAMPGFDAFKFAANLALERPLPTVLLTSDESPGKLEGGLATPLRLVRVPHSLLEDSDGFGATHIRTKLRLAAARAREAKFTITRNKLTALLDELVDEEEDNARPGVGGLVTNALDVIVLAGGRKALPALEEVLRGTRRLRVPVIVALDDVGKGDPLDVPGRRGPPLRRLTSSVSVRRLFGLSLVPANAQAWLEGEMLQIRVGDGVGLDHRRLLESLAPLGRRVLAVKMSPGRTDIDLGLSKAAMSGVTTAVIRNGGLETPESDVVQLRTHELAWVLNNSIPHRV